MQMKRKDTPSIPSHWLFYLIAGIGMVILLLHWYTFSHQTQIDLNKIVDAEVNQINNDLQNQSEPRISALKQLAKPLQASPTHNFYQVILVLDVLIAVLFILICLLAYLLHKGTDALYASNKNLTKEIAEKNSSEETKQKLERDLLHGQKLQAIGTLAGGIAHDFNNILYAIMGYAEMAQEDVPPHSLVYQNLGKVLLAGKRGQELVSRILMFSRRQVFEFKKINLDETLEEVLSLLRSTIPTSITIHYAVLISEKTYIMGNQTNLHQVIMNIVNNAVDAMDGEGEISITLEKVLSISPLLKQLPNLPAVNYYKVDITDQGHGMDQITQERIFEPFFTTKEVGKGTGLGLATAHAIIKEHNGDILVTSELGKGSTFSLLIPVYFNKEFVNGENIVS